MQSYLSSLTFLFNPVPQNPQVGKAAAVGIFMVFLWVTEAIPLAATSLAPLILFPILGIIPAAKYQDLYQFYHIPFLGGFMIALAMKNGNYTKELLSG